MSEHYGIMQVVSIFLLGWTSAMMFMYGVKKYMDWRDGGK